jgi:hypothetical protein
MQIYNWNNNSSKVNKFLDAFIDALDVYGPCIVLGLVVGFGNALFLDPYLKIFDYNKNLDYHLLYLTLIIITNSLASGVLGYCLKSKNFRLKPVFKIESIIYGIITSLMFFIALFGSVNYAIVINGSLLFLVMGTAFYFLGIKLISIILKKTSKRLLNLEAAIHARNAIEHNVLENKKIPK